MENVLNCGKKTGIIYKARKTGDNSILVKVNLSESLISEYYLFTLIKSRKFGLLSIKQQEKKVKLLKSCKIVILAL